MLQQLPNLRHFSNESLATLCTPPFERPIGFETLDITNCSVERGALIGRVREDQDEPSKTAGTGRCSQFLLKKLFFRKFEF